MRQNDKIHDSLATKSASKRPNRLFREKMGVLGQPLSGFSVENYYLCAVFYQHNKIQMKKAISDNLDYTENDNRFINHLYSGMPRWVITAGFIIMVVAAICTITAIDHWLKEHAPVAIALINTVGMVTMYYATMRSMKRLYHPLTVWWIIVLVLNIVSFFSILFEAALPEVSFVVACALPLAYLPLGALIIIWYRGRLQQVGIWMIVRILVIFLLPIAWYMTLGAALDNLIMDAIIVIIELIYAWQFYRLLRC